LLKDKIDEYVKEDHFSQQGLEFSESFFIMAKYGMNGPISGFENETICALGNDENMEKEDINRLKELGWRLIDPGGEGNYMWTHSDATN